MSQAATGAPRTPPTRATRWSSLREWEQRGEVGLHLGHQRVQVVELEAVSVHREDRAQREALGPLLVALVQLGEVVPRDALLVPAGAPADAVEQGGHGSAEIDDEIGRVEKGRHRVEQFGVVAEVPLVHQALQVQVAGEDLGVLVDRAVLDHRSRRGCDRLMVLEALAEEEDLQVKAPARHIGVEVRQIGVLVHDLVIGPPAELLAQQRRDRGLPRPDVPAHRYEPLHRRPASSTQRTIARRSPFVKMSTSSVSTASSAVSSYSAKKRSYSSRRRWR